MSEVPDPLLQSAVDYHQTGRLQEAEAAYRDFLSRHPSHRDALRFLGGLYIQTGRMADAIPYLEQAALVEADAEILANLGIALRGAGRDSHAVTLYEQIARSHPGAAAAHYHYAAALAASGKVAAAIVQYEQALALESDYLDAAIGLGMAFNDIGRDDAAAPWLRQAQNQIERILAAEPRSVAALNNLGNVLQRQGKPEQALAPYRQALLIQPDFAQAALNLATCLRGLGRLTEAIEMARHALGLMPQSADAHANLGVFLQDMARHEEAVEVFEQALRLQPASLYAQWNLSFSLLALGRYREGWALHDVGVGVTSMRGKNPFPERRWTGQDIKGKRLLIWSEQGLGDSLQFIRYAAMCKARGGSLIVQCPPALRRLFANIPCIDALVDTANTDDFDFHVAMMSLPHLFGTTLDTIPSTVPYLHVSAATRARWRFPEKTRFRVGLVWAGNPRAIQLSAHRTDRRRSIALDALRPLFALENVDFYSLQMGAAAAQIDSCGLRRRFIDLMPDVRDFEDTAAIVEQLDLVISVDTSVVHLAGGMGKPVWVLSRLDACWRWLQNRPDNPWYPTARVFGQTAPGDWTEVVARIYDELKTRVIA